MKLARFVEGAGIVSGFVVDNHFEAYQSLGPDPFGDFVDQSNPDELSLPDFFEVLIDGEEPLKYDLSWVEHKFIMPMVPSEVWAAGVTYRRSVDAREDETDIKGIYDMVYESERPEVLLKALGYRTVGPNDIICIRSDATWSVPEPEFTLVYAEREIVGYTIGNDVSSRDIEGANPLYLPQAKIFRNSCAIGPYLVTADEVKDPRNVGIRLRIHRDGDAVFSGDTSTANMKRTFEELTEHMFRDNPVPLGSIMLTGVGVVPSDDFTLQDGDLVEISMDGLGTMRNYVRHL
ncbi:MAG: fumarylacetoacetate hydrolase family protein [Candidatus Thorarchaeota archaeon]